MIDVNDDRFEDLLKTRGDAADAENLAETLAAMVQREYPCSHLAHLLIYLHHSIQDIEDEFVSAFEVWHESDPEGYDAYIALLKAEG